MAAASLVLACVAGFAIALAREMRRPRIADSDEAEQVTGIRVLAGLAPGSKVPERSRRRADQETSTLVDGASDAYRMLHLHLASWIPRISLITVTGDDPTVTALVGANIAAGSSYEARTTLLIDADLPSGALASLLRVRGAPGVAEVLAGQVDWAATIVPAIIGRERTMDVVPAGGSPEPPQPVAAEPVRHNLARIARRYDLVVVVTSQEQIVRGADSILTTPDVIFCARTGITGLDALRAGIDALRGAGARVRGLVLWNTHIPELSRRTAGDSSSDLSRPLSAAGKFR
jgi:Mrp family chromosome partitioning ATPase